MNKQEINNQHPEVIACKGEEKCSKSVSKITEDVANGTKTRNPPVNNPKDCSGQANVAAKEDTNNCVLPSDSKFTYKCICDWSKDDKYGFIPNTECPVHGKQTKQILLKTVPIR